MNRLVSSGPGARMSAVVALLSIGIFFALPNGAEGVPPEGVPADAKPFAGLDQKKVDAWTSGSRLFLVLNKSAVNDQNGIRIARLANIVKKVHWQPDSGQTAQLQPEPDHWLIKLGEKSDDAAKILVMELDEPAKIFDESIISEPDSEKIINLPAKHAMTHGSLLRFEPQPHKNTVGYWANVKDTAEWNFRAMQPGSYEVDILQGCGKGHGGSKVDVVIGDQKLTFDVQDTGHFQNFIWKTIGTLDLPAMDKGVLRLIPVQKAGDAVMDVRRVRLVPAGTKRSLEPELADPAALPMEF